MQSLCVLTSTAKSLAPGVQEMLQEGSVLLAVTVIRGTESSLSFSCWFPLAEARAECISQSSPVHPASR